jgi:hypothetical protein
MRLIPSSKEGGNGGDVMVQDEPSPERAAELNCQINRLQQAGRINRAENSVFSFIRTHEHAQG